ncbi:MAG TPA: beta-N-acetylhexosaminidase [Chitinophagaceae bacterium]|nr:beta-N-acetylhexosaminidase [Chitinophagaceae bacterium]
MKVVTVLKRKLFLSACIVLIACQASFSQTGDFAVKAFHLDLRIQVMKMHALKNLALQLHGYGINTLIMEYEGTYPYQKHPLIPNKYAYTKQEIISFLHFCDSLHLDVIPLQQSFGHVEYILRNYRYAALREDDKDLSQVCPLEVKKDSALFTDLFTELAEAHTSKYIHIGCDETHLLGHCPKCSKKVAEEGVSKLYIDYVKMLCNIVIRLGKRPVLWADIALKYPDAIKSLPRETVFVDWNYGWDVNRFGNQQKLLQSGFEIWGAPSIRSYPDDYFLTQWEKHFNNIKTFIPLCRQFGYKGMVLTSWSTSGQYSYLNESEDELTQLYAQRHVYPVTAFNLLIEAYAKSLSQQTPMDIKGFIMQAVPQRYGLDKQQTLNFWQALTTPALQVENGIVKSDFPRTLAEITHDAENAASVFKKLQPSKNQVEFEHYRLMADIRVQYLHYLLIEQWANSAGFTQKDVPAALRQLKVLLANASQLDKRFIELNKDSYYITELKAENEVRNKRLQILYDKLNRSRF